MTPPAADDAQSIVRSIRKTLRGLVIATIVLFIAVGAVGVIGYGLADKNREAVCNLKVDLERRVQASEEFALKHPDTLEKFGLTPAQVQKEINNQQRTIVALRVVPCD